MESRTRSTSVYSPHTRLMSKLTASAASYLPGQSQPRDAFSSDARDPTQAGASRGGTGTMLDSLKPSGEKAKVEGDK